MAENENNPCQVGSASDRWCKQPKPPDIIPKPHPGSHVKFKLLALLVGFPIIIANTVSLFVFRKEKERPPYVPYSYLNIRHKKFPWGDGDHCFFHNPKMNHTSQGYEDAEE